ncbi:RagB/SusD family nutrient uptake outer membrane protein [Bacteroides timonensis]|uniref:RagB/SusD family nutrient uptake outer membrane protein n=1 Tax=Bacteroides timonensis TaxID=1470345 RepID=UPI0004B9EA51|nr:RagB/SusD family nutrient uptake outer membrane protein [Bacteroides timonensis]
MKLKYIFMTSLVALGLSSCNDFLEVEAPSKYENGYVFNDRTEIDRALNGVYAQLLSSDTYGSAYLSTFCLNSDVDMAIYTNDVATNNSYRRFDCSPTGGEVEKTWNAAYKGVEYANNFIYQLENSELYAEGDEELNQMMGEAKVMRAMFYHDLVVMFGDIPFSLEPSSGAEDNGSLLLPVTDREEIHKVLIADLKSIAPKMQLAADLSAGVERVSKEFCWSMIARMALTCGGYSLRPDQANTASYGKMERPANYKDYYEIVRQYCDSVISSGKHSLNLSYRQVFIDECNYKVNNNDDPIFEIPFGKNSTGSIGYIQGPSSDLFEGNTSGTNIWGECKGNARLNALYRFLFDEGDTRRDYVTGLWYYQYDGTPKLRNDRTVHNNKWSKLWTTASMGANSQGNTGINYPYMRYADVLLMYAEAVNELEGGVDGTNGSKAVEALRQVRNRAFAGDAGTVENYLATVSANKDTFLKAVLDERKFEFAGENMRWKDLVRNNMYGEEVYYSFMRYYGIAMNGESTMDMEDISIHDGKNADFWESIPYTIFYKDDKTGVANPNDVNVYPNTSMNILTFYKNCLYDKKSNADTDGETDWTKATLFGWWNTTDGIPENQMLYSYYGYIRGDYRGIISVIRDGNPEIPSLDNLPPVRYILPYPNSAIQRSAGAYKNYYGY